MREMGQKDGKRKPLICPQCGGVINPARNRCEYCGVYFEPINQLPNFEPVIRIVSEYMPTRIYMARAVFDMNLVELLGKDLTMDHVKEQLANEISRKIMESYEKIVAGVPEPWKSQQYGRIYINAGVSFWNLEYMREIGADVMFIWQLNQKHYDFCEQDCLNELFRGFIYPLPGEFNVCAYTTMPEGPIRIRHFAAEKDWFEKPVVMEWRK